MWIRVKVSHPPIHVTHLSCDHLICKESLSSLFLGQSPPILAKCHLSWVDLNHQVTWFIYHVITLYLQKGASPVSQRQLPLNLIGLWVRVKGPNLLFQVTCPSSEHFLFEKRHVSTNPRQSNIEISSRSVIHAKSQKSKAFSFVIQKMLTFDSHQYTLLWS